MSDKPKMKLSEQASGILRDLCFSRMKVLRAEDISSADELPKHTELGEFAARQSLLVFDFFRSAMAGHEEAVKRQLLVQHSMGPRAGGEYYDGMIEEYQSMMTALMQQGGYTADDVLHLQNRVKGFVKALKTGPARTLYISDCHFYHDRICREMDNRGFSGFEEMNEHMIAQWNKKVTARDDVYILGDFCISKGDAAARILDRLNGKKHLIVGNHDKYLDDKRFDRSWFRSIETYQEIRDNGRTVILSHYPVFCYKGQYRTDQRGNPLTYMLYGHVHNTHDEALINRFITETRATLAKSRYSDQPQPIPCYMINGFCMFSNYQPMTLDEWIEIDRKRRTGLEKRDRVTEPQEAEILYPNVKRAIEEVMDAAIARTNADDILEEGQNEAAALFRLLLETGREDDLRNAADDLNYFRILMKQKTTDQLRGAEE